MHLTTKIPIPIPPLNSQAATKKKTAPKKKKT
eukprot:CAMPEP_0181046686 /NCGR_PEP_ID=MMETSP1070-20121207/14478_1 /TAXON_ID=265543 /ORGANISM="Minutocellus polymorphus, Strain NH13" /LENGTH=31 /DNA_ID= /DNA_START= /DNA_END= /DNA_ORIENTATION=